MHAVIIKLLSPTGLFPLYSSRIFLLLFYFVYINCGLASDPPWRSVWNPSEHLTNMAFFLAEHYSQYILADRSDQGIPLDFRNNAGEYVYNDVDRQTINSQWQVFGYTYTNYVRRCRAFIIESSDRRMIPIIAVQHILNIDENIQYEEKGFTLYYNLCNGKISRELDLFPVVVFSPAPPYYLSPPMRIRKASVPQREADQDVSVEFIEPGNKEQTAVDGQKGQAEGHIGTLDEQQEGKGNKR